MQSIEIAKGQFVMASSISSYEFDPSLGFTTITLKGRKKNPYRVDGDYVKYINQFLARGSIILYRDGTMQDRK